MNRGSASSGRAASTAGLNRSVCPTARTAPASLAAAIIASASASDRAIGFSTSTGMPADRNGSATSRCASVGTATMTASTLPINSRASNSGCVWLAAANLSAALAVGVDHCHQLNARQRRQNPRVMPAQVTDADDGHFRS